jgi:mannose-6-phosphate isomerase-like protein (cupin superfamily)
MDDTLLETYGYDGNGYKPLIDFGAWRVAFLRYLDEIQPDRIDSMERHTETDEVFVLLQGRGMIIMGGNGAQVDGIYPQRMESGRLYNVKLNSWHTILLSRDATVLLVENRDTGRHNSEYSTLSAEPRRLIVDLAKRELFD